ncbi:ABC transporter permease [Dongia deserti]|uniref:ABC transporter permease n=1 Tax=Dongia deserti TaxID=2268030 RepID=UPI000E65AF60|nr:ABC transporter permease [Dongia deserti]
MTLLAWSGWRIERRSGRSSFALVSALLSAGAGAVLCCALLFLAAGADPIAAFAALAKGSFGSTRAIADTLVRATPLILTGLATAIAFRARLWNIGAEGQVFAGAMFAFWCQSAIGAAPAYLQIPVIVLGSLCGGALFGALAGALKARFQVDEVIATVMLNYIIIYALSLLLQQGPWTEPGGFFEQTAMVPDQAKLPILIEKTRLHLGFVLALVLAAILHVVLHHSPLGYEIRAAGSNLRALQVQGVHAGRLILVVFALSGAIAGLAGAFEVYGVQYRLKSGTLGGLGYTGIIIAILGQLSPRAVVIAGLLFGALLNGSTLMQIRTGVPSALIYAIEAIILMFFLIAWAISQFRLRRLRDVD